MITNKKEYNITNYEAVFNDTNLMCGVTINLDQYTLPLQELEDSLFKIDFDNSKIVVENNKYIINFHNADMELLSKACKSEKFPIFYGRSKNLSIDGCLLVSPHI